MPAPPTACPSYDRWRWSQQQALTEIPPAGVGPPRFQTKKMTKNWSIWSHVGNVSTSFKSLLPVYRFIPQFTSPAQLSLHPHLLLFEISTTRLAQLRKLFLLTSAIANSFSSVSRLELRLSLLVHLLFAISTQSDGSGTRCSERQHDEAKEGSAKARASEGGHSQVRDAGRGFDGPLRCALYVISTKHIVALQQQLKWGMHARMRDPTLNEGRSACTTGYAILMRSLFERQLLLSATRRADRCICEVLWC